MSELLTIESTLERARRRRRVERGFRSLWKALFVAALVWVLLVVAYKLAPIPDDLVAQSWMILPVAAIAAFLYGFSRRMSLIQTARWVDEQRDLKQRLSTALEFSTTGEQNDWQKLILTDAAKSIHGLNERDLLPFRLPAASRWALIVLILGVGLGFVPEYRTKTYVQKKADEKAIKEAGRELASLTKRNLQARPPALETTKKALEEVGNLGDHMTKADLTRSDALKDIASVTEKLKDQTRDLMKDPAVRNLERASRSSSKGGSPSADLQQKMEALAKQLGAKAADSDSLEKMRQDLEKAKEMAQNLPKGDSAEAKQAQDKLNAQLADLAKQAKDLGLDLPSLSDAIAALQNAEPDQVLKDLQVAEVELEKMQSMAKALEKMQLNAQKLGKDLAEQLKNGQAEAAQATLQKMMKQLQESNPSAEEMDKMMQEVQNALPPAEQYGEVGEHMQAALQQMKQGDKGEAGQSLGKAAEALGKMMQELGDAQSLLASLEGLQQAQMMIANGMGWGQQGQKGRPGAGEGRGQTTRGGVGTWHDEDSWEYPEFADKWDNTGVDRPDEDGRGITDRGEGQLADNLAPTKLKGQITPGGPMPSVTLKGVSIKGTSKVQVQEMDAAAQSEAQAALNQDQVPRAYQGAVRNYFDDLKE